MSWFKTLLLNIQKYKKLFAYHCINFKPFESPKNKFLFRRQVFIFLVVVPPIWRLDLLLRDEQSEGAEVGEKMRTYGRPEQD